MARNGPYALKVINESFFASMFPQFCILEVIDLNGLLLGYMVTPFLTFLNLKFDRNLGYVG